VNTSTDLEEKLNLIDKKLDQLNELTGKVDAISADVDDIQDDMDDVSKHAALQLDKASLVQVRTLFFGVVALIMALGQFSEAVSLIGDGWRSLKSQFTNSVEYSALAKLHVGNTESYAQSLFGEAQVSRKINDQITANYYYQKKMLLTLFIKDSRISAFTVLALKEGFSPRVDTITGKDLTLGNFTYAQYPAMPTVYLDDNSKSDSFYLESLEAGQIGLHFKRYLGSIRYGTGKPSPLIQQFYKLDLTGSDTKALAKAQNALRTDVKPNFYGAGELGIELIEKSLLTDAEFTNYFIAQK
jgi:hypothetical protein